MKMARKSKRAAGFLACLLALTTACTRTDNSGQTQADNNADGKDQAAASVAAPPATGRDFQAPASCHELSFSQQPVDNGKFRNVVLYGCEEATVAELSATFRERLEDDGFRLKDAGSVADDDRFTATKAGSMKLTIRLTLAKKPVEGRPTLARAQWFIAAK